MQERIDESKLIELFKGTAEGDEADVLSAGLWLQTELGSDALPSLLDFIDRFDFKEIGGLANLIRLASHLQSPDEPTIPLTVLKQFDSDNLQKRIGYSQAISRLGDIAIKDLIGYIKNHATSKTGKIQALLSLRYNLTDMKRALINIERRTPEGIKYEYADPEPIALDYSGFYAVGKWFRDANFYVSGAWLQGAANKISEISHLIFDNDTDIRRHAVALALTLGKHCIPLIMNALRETNILEVFQKLSHDLLSVEQLPSASDQDNSVPDNYILNQSLLFILSESDDIKRAISENKINSTLIPNIDQHLIQTLFFTRPTSPDPTDHPDDIIWTKRRNLWSTSANGAYMGLRLTGVQSFRYALQDDNLLGMWWTKKTALDQEEDSILRLNAMLGLAMEEQPKFTLDILEGKIAPATKHLESLYKRAAFEAIAFGVTEETPAEVINTLLDFAALDLAQETFGDNEVVFPIYALAFIDRNPSVEQFLWETILSEDETPARRLQALFSFIADRGSEDFEDGFHFHEIRIKQEPTTAGISLSEFNPDNRHARAIIIGPDFDFAHLSFSKIINLFVKKDLWTGFIDYEILLDGLLKIAGAIRNKYFLDALSDAFKKVPSELRQAEIKLQNRIKKAEAISLSVPSSLVGEIELQVAVDAIGLLFENHMYSETAKTAHIVLNNRQYFWLEIPGEENYIEIYKYLIKSEVEQNNYDKAIEPAKKVFDLNPSTENALVYGVLEGATNGGDAVRKILGAFSETVDANTRIPEILFQKQVFPIAYSARKIKSVDNVDYLRDFHNKIETMTKSLAIILMGASYHFGIPVTESERKKLLKPSFGDWKHLAFSYAKKIADNKPSVGDSVIVELATALNRGRSNDWISDIVNERNDFEHGGNLPPRKTQEEMLKKHFPKLRKFLLSIRPLESSKLVFITTLNETLDDDRGGYYSGLSLMGAYEDFDSIKGEKITKGMRLPSVCLLLENNAPIPLDPFVIYNTCKCNREHFFMLNKIDMDKRAIKYHSLTCDKSLSESRGEKGFKHLESMGFI